MKIKNIRQANYLNPNILATKRRGGGNLRIRSTATRAYGSSDFHKTILPYSIAILHYFRQKAEYGYKTTLHSAHS